jgi:hypothetical protein
LVTDWSILGGDPAPGGADTFEFVANALGPITEIGQSSADFIRSMAGQAGSNLWSGIAASAFGESVHAMPRDLGDLVVAHQTAMRSLTDYAATLRSLQQQAAQVLSNALSAQRSADSAQARLESAEGRYNSANEQYWIYHSKVDVLEVERDVANAAGEHAVSATLSHQIALAVESRNAAWSARAAAQSDIQSAQSALNSARQDLANQQAAARSIASERQSAADTLAALLSSASEFVIGKRSWIDRVEKDFVSVADFQWRAADRTIRSTGRSLLRVGGDVDSFARVHAEKVRNVSDIVNHYANDVSEIAGKVGPYFAAAGIAIDVLTAPFPGVDALGVEIGAHIGNIPTDVALGADTVGTAAAAVALGADELAEVPPSQRTAQFEADKLSLEGSGMHLEFDDVDFLIGQVLPDSQQVSREFMSGGALNIVKASANFEAQNYVVPDVQNDVQSKLVPN